MGGVVLEIAREQTSLQLVAMTEAVLPRSMWIYLTLQAMLLLLTVTQDDHWVQHMCVDKEDSRAERSRAAPSPTSLMVPRWSGSKQGVRTDPSKGDKTAEMTVVARRQWLHSRPFRRQKHFSLDTPAGGLLPWALTASSPSTWQLP